MRDPVFIPASTAILSKTTLREDFAAGLTKTWSNRVIFGVTLFDLEVDLMGTQRVFKGCIAWCMTY